jgi:hypothetical protein
MTFNNDRQAYVWIWLPGETKPVVAGRLEADNGNVLFNYGKNYLGRVGSHRFDRVPKGDGWSRKAMVSALTLFGLDDMMARYASYETFAEIIRHRFTEPKATLTEVFSRLVFNILCGNTDDHARNHAAFWNGKELTLTPAYDICPQGRTGNEASQAMLISAS